MIPVFRLDLGDGDYAMMYEELRHGTVKTVAEIYQPYLAKPEVAALLQADGEEDDRLNRIFQIVGGSADVIGAQDALILGQVKEWSFGEVTQDVLENAVSHRKRNIMYEEANRRYGDIPLAKSGAGN